MIPNKYNRAAEHRGLHRGESLSIRNVFPKGVRVTTVDARTHAVDSVSRKTYFSKYYKTAAPRPTMTSSCKSNPGRRWILGRRNPYVIMSHCSDIRDSFCIPRKAFRCCANNRGLARPTRATIDVTSRCSRPSLDKNVRVS